MSTGTHLCRACAVSNFNIATLQALEDLKIAPIAVNQFMLKYPSEIILPASGVTNS